MNILSKKGFSITELMVVLVIIAILASIAIPYYERFVERMRIAEADTVMGAAIASQEHVFLRSQHYTRAWHKLDAAPVMVRQPKAQNDYANGIDNTVFYTRGGVLSGVPRAGFAISCETDANGNWFAVAQRVGHGDYTYRLVRPFKSTQTTCVPDWSREKDLSICIDYMGVDTADELSADPMVPSLETEGN